MICYFNFNVYSSKSCIIMKDYIRRIFTSVKGSGPTSNVDCSASQWVPVSRIVGSLHNSCIWRVPNRFGA